MNSGIACIQDALPPSVFDTLPGLGEPLPPIEDPGFVSSEVEILAYETSWVIVADGVELEPNRGGVRVKINTEIPIVGMVGLHTVTLNGEKEGDDFDAGYRFADELKAWQSKDPLIQDSANFKECIGKVDSEVATAVDFAEASPWPTEKELLTDVL